MFCKSQNAWKKLKNVEKIENRSKKKTEKGCEMLNNLKKICESRQRQHYPYDLCSFSPAQIFYTVRKMFRNQKELINKNNDYKKC